jgi:hypothetical protein
MIFLPVSPVSPWGPPITNFPVGLTYSLKSLFPNIFFTFSIFPCIIINIDIFCVVFIAAIFGLKAVGIEVDEELIKASVKIPAKYKIVSEHKKAILREFAEKEGLPKEFAWRKKIAAQYGSGFDKAMEKLAKKNKLKTKKE